MARILILGGAGMEGSATAKLFAKEQDISELIIADRRMPAAEKVAHEIGKKASARELNVDDHDGMVNVMKEVDVVANFVGPFYRHLIKVLRAAIEAKVAYYVDICDDGEPVEEAFNTLDGAAKEAGTTALLGMGDGPGFSNLCCMFGGSKLDRLEKVHVYWGGNIAGLGGGVGAALHGFYCFRAKVPQFLNGKLVHVPPRSGSEIVEFPDCTAEAFYSAQSEQYTFPRYVKGLKEVTNKGVIGPSQVMEDYVRLGELGFAEDEPVKIKRGLSVNPIDVATRIHSIYWFSPDRGDLGKKWFNWKNEVVGQRNGKTVTIDYAQPKGLKPERMDVFTSACAIVGMLMLIRGEVLTREKGVFAPEGMIDATIYLPRVVKQSGQALIETETVDGEKTVREV